MVSAFEKRGRIVELKLANYFTADVYNKIIMSLKDQDKKVDVDFESHPPIEDDLNGITSLLRQTLLQFVDCHSLARHLIEQKDLSQVIAQVSEEEDSDNDDEPDNDIYGVSSIIDLPLDGAKAQGSAIEARLQLMEFISDKCPEIKDILNESRQTNDGTKAGMLVNERYINLPAQLSLPTFKALTESIDRMNYTYLILVSKILLSSRETNTKLPSKKSKSSANQANEPLIFLNPEEEIICEQSECHTDVDVSAYCDENATWSFSSDIKYVPYRRIMLIDYKKWSKILISIEKEL